MNSTRPIAYNMTKTVLALTLLIGLVLGSIQLVWDYQTQVENLNERVEEVLKSIEKAAVKAVYTFDVDLAGEVAAGLFEFPPISSVVIKDENNRDMTNMVRYRGSLPFEPVTSLFFEDVYKFHIPLRLNNVEDYVVGVLSIEVTPHRTVESFLRRSLAILAAAFLESFIISAILLFVFFRRVTRPLHLLATDFTNINPEMPEKSNLSLERSLLSSEFEEVIQTGNNMLRIIGSQLRARDRAEAELKRQKNETERYLKIAEAIILQLDKDGKVTMINQQGLEVTGYELNEILGQDWFELAIEESEQKHFRKMFHKLLNKPSQNNEDVTAYFENDILTKTGEKRKIFWHNALETDHLGNPVGILSSGQDVTARKAAEDALRATEISLRAIIEATSEGFAITDLSDLILLDVNSAFHELLGYSPDEMINHPIQDFINQDDIRILNNNMQESQQRTHRTFELRLRRKDGTDVPVEITASNLPNGPGGNKKAVTFISDITERKKREENQKTLEKQLRQAQKMETIGTLAGGIAHDFNNILTPILGYSSLLSSRIPKDDPNHNRIEQIAKSANRAATMVKQILTFSRRTEGEMLSTHIAPVIAEAMSLVRSTTPSNIEFIQNIPENCPPIVADATQIQQMVLNLCTNATHSMEGEGGTLEVSLEEVHLDEKDTQVSPTLHEGDYLLLTVKDTGHGMDEETLSRIFDPFYTTKKSGQGTGLGLAMVHGIVQNHNGDIFVESAPDKGSIFKIHLPVSELPVLEAQDLPVIVSGQNELALIVDDEEINIEFISELMQEAGYQSESHTDSIVALDAFMQDPDKYNIILTDQTMPKLTGDQMVQAIREIRPDIPIIMMSGYDRNISMENAQDVGVDVYLQKPVSIDALTKAMSELLHRTDEVG